jgi:hypothetical protein
MICFTLCFLPIEPRDVGISKGDIETESIKSTFNLEVRLNSRRNRKIGGFYEK